MSLISALSVFFFFLREFQPMVSTFDNSFLSSDQDTKSVFLCRRGLNPKFLIQLLKTLPVLTHLVANGLKSSRFLRILYQIDFLKS